MVFGRAVARLRARDWVAITIELATVIVGVLIGRWWRTGAVGEAGNRAFAAAVET